MEIDLFSYPFCGVCTVWPGITFATIIKHLRGMGDHFLSVSILYELDAFSTQCSYLFEQHYKIDYLVLIYAQCKQLWPVVLRGISY